LNFGYLHLILGVLNITFFFPRKGYISLGKTSLIPFPGSLLDYSIPSLGFWQGRTSLARVNLEALEGILYFGLAFLILRFQGQA